MSEPVFDPMSALTVDIAIEETGGHDAGRMVALVRAAVEAALSRLAPEPEERLELSVVITGDEQIAQLNRDYRGRAGPTNVLSFPQGPAAAAGPAGRMLGDIALSVQRVDAEARAQEIPFADHLRHLVIHGLLHLFGYDHNEDAAATRMETLEAEILAVLEVPDPYRDEQPAEAGRMSAKSACT